MTLDLPYPWVDDEAIQGNFDRIKAEWPEPSSVWTAYTATATNATLGTGGSSTGRYQKSGRTVVARGRIVLGTGGSLSGALSVLLPFTAESDVPQIGVASGYDSSAGTLASGYSFVTEGTSSVIFRLGTSAVGPVAVAAADPWTWADSDTLTWQLTYETAF